MELNIPNAPNQVAFWVQKYLQLICLWQCCMVHTFLRPLIIFLNHMYQVEYVPRTLAGPFGTLYSVREAEWPVPNGGDETLDGIGDIVGVLRMEVSETRGRRHQRGFHHQFQRHGDDPTLSSVQPMMMQKTGMSEMTLL